MSSWLSEMPLLRSLRRNANASVQCPIEEGKYEVEQTVALPREIPRGKLSPLHAAILLTPFGQPSSMFSYKHIPLMTKTCFASN